MRRYCYNCMQPIEDYLGVCPHCGQAPFGVNPVHQLKTGTRLKDRYLIGKSLGQGGFGITYIGLDTTLDVRVAVKEYYPNGISNRNHEVTDNITQTSSSVELYNKGKFRFLQEAKTLARFSEEPGVVSVHDFFEDNNTAYIVMEYLDGITLKRFVEARGKVPANALFRAMGPIMRSLEKIHAQDVIHRDISPDNVMLLRDGTLKLLDFGSAREVGGDKSLSVMLKPGYAPEEQYRSKGKQGPWTDIYALCATMYYCLTEVKPDESVERMVEDTLQRPSELGADITQAQESVILRGMAVHAKDRYQSIAELTDALKASPTRVVVPDSPEPIPNDEPNDTPKSHRRRKKNLLWLIVGILAVVLLAFTGMKIFGMHESNPAISEPVLTPIATESQSPTPLPTPVPTPQPLTAEEIKYVEAENLLASGDKAHAAMAFYKLGNYRDARERSFALWKKIEQNNVLAAGECHTVGVLTDGTVIAVGDNSNGTGQCNVTSWENIIAVAAGAYHTVGLRDNGTVVATGFESHGESSVSRWANISSIAAGGYHTIGLQTNGTVVAVGSNDYGECEVSDWTDIIAIAVGNSRYRSHTVGLKSDGTVVATKFTGRQDHYNGQCEVSDWTDIVAIAAGGYHTVGLRADGTVVAVGANDYGECEVSDWTNIVAITAGEAHTVGLRIDGTVVATGWNGNGECETGDWTDIIAIVAGPAHTVGLRADGTVIATGWNDYMQCNVSDWTEIATNSGKSSKQGSTE